MYSQKVIRLKENANNKYVSQNKVWITSDRHN